RCPVAPSSGPPRLGWDRPSPRRRQRSPSEWRRDAGVDSWRLPGRRKGDRDCTKAASDFDGDSSPSLTISISLEAQLTLTPGACISRGVNMGVKRPEKRVLWSSWLPGPQRLDE